MDLNEFLGTASLDDEVALSEAKAHTVKKYSNISSSLARQYFSLMGVSDVIEANEQSTEVVEAIPGIPTTVGQLCKAVNNTISSGGTFATDPSSSDGALNRAASGLIGLSGPIVTGFFGLGETLYQPFKNITLEQVKAIRHEAVWEDCDHGPLGYVESRSQGDAFTFVAQFTRPNSSYFIRLKWRESDEHEWKTYSSNIPMKGHETELVVSQQVKRTGATSAARHFKFQFKANDSEAISSVFVGV